MGEKTAVFASTGCVDCRGVYYLDQSVHVLQRIDVQEYVQEQCSATASMMWSFIVHLVCNESQKWCHFRRDPVAVSSIMCVKTAHPPFKSSVVLLSCNLCKWRGSDPFWTHPDQSLECFKCVNRPRQWIKHTNSVSCVVKECLCVKPYIDALHGTLVH